MIRLPKLVYIYTLYSYSFPFRFKIGITERAVKDRCLDIQRSIKHETGHAVTVRKFIAVPSFFAYRIEQYLHRKFARFSHRMPGSGKTEWFLYFNFGSCLLFLIALYGLDLRVSPAYGAVLLLAPLPLDFALLLIAALFIETVTVVCGVILLLTFLKNIL